MLVCQLATDPATDRTKGLSLTGFASLLLCPSFMTFCMHSASRASLPRYGVHENGYKTGSPQGQCRACDGRQTVPRLMRMLPTTLMAAPTTQVAAPIAAEAT